MRRENLKIRILAVAILALSTSWAVAAQPVDKPEKPAKPTKTTILHCGCSDSGDAMVYAEISVSSRSWGHQNHTINSTDSCDSLADDGTTVITTDYSRIGPDCLVQGELEGLSSCSVLIEGVEAGTPCGVLNKAPVLVIRPSVLVVN